jgi:hypothetical protein
MILATVNKSKRLLYVRYVGRVHAADLAQSRKELPALVAEFSDGFRVLADMDRLEHMDSGGSVELGKIMECFDKKGIEMVVRVMPDPSKDIGLNILSIFHYRRPVPTLTCMTMQEAAKHLAL